MKVKYVIGQPLEFYLDCSNCKEVFREIAEIQQVFAAEKQCGLCGLQEIRLRVRTVDRNEFFELVCADCGATLALGQNKDGEGIYPKRKDKRNKPLPHGGWREMWTGDADQEPAYAEAR